MKKLHGTKHAHIGTSYTPILDAKFDAIQAELRARDARLLALMAKVKKMMDEEKK